VLAPILAGAYALIGSPTMNLHAVRKPIFSSIAVFFVFNLTPGLKSDNQHGLPGCWVREGRENIVGDAPQS
jgi:hypothetical protein